MVKTGLIGDQFSREWCHFSTTVTLFNQLLHHNDKVKTKKMSSFTLNSPKEMSTRQKFGAFLFLVDLFRVDLFTFSMNTWAWLTAKLLLNDGTLLCPVEEWEARAVSNILSVTYLCLFCVSKGVVSTAECWGTHEGGEKSNWHRPFWENSEIEGRQRAKSQFSEDLQTLLFSQLCLAALWE